MSVTNKNGIYINSVHTVHRYRKLHIIFLLIIIAVISVPIGILELTYTINETPISSISELEFYKAVYKISPYIINAQDIVTSPDHRILYVKTAVFGEDGYKGTLMLYFKTESNMLVYSFLNPKNVKFNSAKYVLTDTPDNFYFYIIKQKNSKFNIIYKNLLIKSGKFAYALPIIGGDQHEEKIIKREK